MPARSLTGTSVTSSVVPARRLTCSSQRFRNLGGVDYRLAHRNRSLAKAFAQSLPDEEFGDQIRRPFVRAHVKHRNNVGMIERRKRARFLLKTAEPCGVASERLRKNFQRNCAIQARVLGLVHLSHAARAH